MIRFENDDLGYLTWTAAHPDGFVLNVRRVADPDYVVLHRANCVSISNDKQAPGAFTGREYRKVCVTSATALQDAAKREGRRDGSFSKRCALCRP
jgi:hypothetical protein